MQNLFFKIIKSIWNRLPETIKIKTSSLKLLKWSIFETESPKQIFSHIYKYNTWQSPESKSGAGSSLFETENIRKEIPKLFNYYKIKTILDIPCGDLAWVSQLKINNLKYIGGDIVPELIEKNIKKSKTDFSIKDMQFIFLDIINDLLPPSDLILVRDCLVHFSNKDIIKSLKNILRSNTKYLLTTSFINLEENKDISTGSWRPINLQIHPFSFPKPIKIIYENHPNEQYNDKSLCLWSVQSLKKTLDELT